MMEPIVDTLNSSEEDVEQETKPDFQSNLTTNNLAELFKYKTGK